MKILKTVVSFLIIISSFNTNAQKVKSNKLVGIWQVGTAQLADAWNSNYRFFNDGTFKYMFNQYDDRGRIKEASGTYKVTGNVLTMVIKKRKELVGGDLVGGSAGFQSEEFVLDGGKMIEIKQKVVAPVEFNIKWFVEKGVKGFTLQNNKYYFISSNPHEQED
jgi:hypothetical protein